MNLTSGALESRVPVYYSFRKTATRQERIKLQKNGSGLTALNGLGSKIVKIRLRDTEGRLFEGTAIDEGGKVTLQPAKDKLQGGITLRSMFVDCSSYLGKNALDLNRFDLRPGTYIAEVEGSPFTKESIEGIEYKSRSSLVYGIMGGTSDED